MTDDLRHPIFARLYPRMDAATARQGGDAHRDELLAGARGRVLEVDAGHGADFRHYGQGVGEVVAVEPEPLLRARAVAATEPFPAPRRLPWGHGRRARAPDRALDDDAGDLPA